MLIFKQNEEERSECGMACKIDFINRKIEIGKVIKFKFEIRMANDDNTSFAKIRYIQHKYFQKYVHSSTL